MVAWTEICSRNRTGGGGAPFKVELHRDDELEVDRRLSRLPLVLEEATGDVLDPNVRPCDDPHRLSTALPVT